MHYFYNRIFCFVNFFLIQNSWIFLGTVFLPIAYVFFSSNNVGFHCMMPWIILIFGTLQECNGACFSCMSHKMSSSISKVGNDVGEINWHISALKFVKFMPHKFLDCLILLIVVEHG